MTAAPSRIFLRHSAARPQSLRGCRACAPTLRFKGRSCPSGRGDVSAPGGDAYDSPDNTLNAANLVLAAYPQRLAELNGDLNPDGTPNNDFVVRDCQGT